MASKSRSFIIQLALMVALLTANVVFSDDNVAIPTDKSQLSTWFNSNVQPLNQRKNSVDPALVTAENGAQVVKVMKDGSGNFKTITDAINSIPRGNTKRVIVYIGGGNYNEKIKIDREKPFITLYGAPGNMPNLTYGGTALQYGTVDSATLIVESDYFVASNIMISNSAPRPDGKRQGAQALALRISGDKASFYNCTLLGFQDTLCDDADSHFYKDCLIQGTVDFVFGNGKALFLNTELRVLGDSGMSVIVAHGRGKETDDTGYSFVHCDITGTGNGTLLGRAWMSHSKVVFAYSNIGSVVNDAAWSNNKHAEGVGDFFMMQNTELRVLGDSGMSVIVAHARDKKTDDTGYSFVHCDITGTGNGTLLGRAWMSHSKVVFAYSNIGGVVNDTAWSNNNHADYDGTLYFGEYKNQGPSADFNGRPKYAKQLTDAEAKPFITLAYIQGSKWLLPPPTPKV